MGSEARATCVVTAFLTAMIVMCCFLIGSCTMQESRTNLPVEIMKTKSEHILQNKCIEARGSWDSTYTNCKFPEK